jgi:hypothetical protein
LTDLQVGGRGWGSSRHRRGAHIQSGSPRAYGRGSHLQVLRALLPPLTAALVLIAPAAQADLTSWLSLGGGYSLSYDGVASRLDKAAVFSGTMGVGSTPISPVVVGGVIRTATRFGLGTDVGLMARVTSGGFSRGDWGFGGDFGASMRWWGSGDYGRYPLQAVLLGGAPWGFQLAVGADLVNLGGQPPARGGFVLLEFDLLRFTLMRQGSTDTWWKNPSPAGGRMPE